MGVPIILILAVVFWMLMSGVKYWYYTRMKINYTYKVDEKVLEDLRKPSKEALERLKKRREEREQKFGDQPNAENFPFESFPTQGERNEKKPEAEGKRRRPMTIFEELDALNEQKKAGKQNNKKKWSRDMFEDPLTRLYKELEEERKKRNAAEKQKKLTD